MANQVNFQNLSVLVADDFIGFRNTVNSILQRLGVTQIVVVATAEDVIDQCQRQQFDVVLCDYNMGRGRTGQHALEELRHLGVLTPKTVFIMVSAESSRNVVMSVYDCEPDDYLMKPVTARTLQSRIERLLERREVFARVNTALFNKHTQKAIALLQDMAFSESRYGSVAQKMLGELYLSEGDLASAERLYTLALEARQLDWARLGLAKVKQARGELELAYKWLERIVHDNPLFLPAYDVLAKNCEQRGDRQKVQSAVQRAVDISPMSILRQKQLGDAAQQNNDLNTALQALRRTVKLGEYSCHSSADHHFGLARAVSLCLDQRLDIGPSAVDEALSVLSQTHDRFKLTEGQSAQRELLSSRIHALEGRDELARKHIAMAETLLEGTSTSIEVQMDYVAALKSVDEDKKAQKILAGLESLYRDDQESLEKLDIMLDEPVSNANKDIVANLNQEGITLYEAGHFDQALVSFEKARKLFPRHIGIQLNIIQTLLGKVRAGLASEAVTQECYASLRLASGIILPDHPQFERFSKLKKMANTMMEKV